MRADGLNWHRRRGHVAFPREIDGGVGSATPPEPLAAEFDTPEWARHAVWYQIMPDRFRNGDPHNDPNPVRPWTSEWFSLSPWEARAGLDFYSAAYRRHYGGDLAGLEQKLPYLLELGVNALYLNPVFKADSYHKYNATDYVHVDDRFGTRGDYDSVAAREDPLDPRTWQWTESDRHFLRFLKTAHAMGFRVIIDGVFNHVGTQHRAFRDVKENRTASRYGDWFDVTCWEPLKYKGWWDDPELPVFRKGPTGYFSRAVKAHIFAVTQRWMAPDGDVSAGIDGWRLDVPNEVPVPFWREWRSLVKSINPDALIMGEIWQRADEWLDGRAFDGVMNYEFARAVMAWAFCRDWKIPATEFDDRLRQLRLTYPVAATYVLQNLMNSHDTDRLVSMAHNPDRPYNKLNRPQDEGVHYDNSKPPPAAYQRARLAALIQMTYIGTPMIYYGDETGMWGASDPTCRKPMLWDDLGPYEQPEQNRVMYEHLEYYRQVIALRHANPALRVGTFRTLLCDNAADVWAFLRADGRQQVVVAINASEKPQSVRITLPTSSPADWSVIFGAARSVRADQGKLPVDLPPVAGIVLATGRS